MHDRDKLHLELGLHITGNVLNGGGDGVPGCERGVHDNTKPFYLEISLVQGFEGASIIKVMVKWYSKMGVYDGSDKGSMFGGRWERAEAVTVNWDINGEDRGDFYSRRRGRGNYGRRERQRGWRRERRTARRQGMFRMPKFNSFCGKGTGSLSRGGDIGWKGVRGRGVRCQGSSRCQRGGTHDV